MATFKVQGGNKLSGEIIPQGAKNEALQILCAVLLTSEEVIIENIPNIRDVNILINLLEDLEIKVIAADISELATGLYAADVSYLVEKYDSEFPKKYFKEFLDYIDISEKVFWETVDNFRSPHIWKKENGEWKLKHMVS